MQKRQTNLASTTDDLYVEVFPPFLDLPTFSFDAQGFDFQAEELLSNDDLRVDYLTAGHYAIYKITYNMLPPDHPEALTYIAYDIDEIAKNARKVYKIYDRYMNELTLGEATYDIGLLFSGGRVLSDTHFLEKKYHE